MFDSVENPTKAKSIKLYGDLIKKKIKVDYENNDYTFQVKENTVMSLSELNNQGDTEEDYTIDNIDSILNFVDFDQTKTKKEKELLIIPKKISPSSEIDNKPKGHNNYEIPLIIGVIFGFFVLIIIIGLFLKKYFKNNKNIKNKKKY